MIGLALLCLKCPGSNGSCEDFDAVLATQVKCGYDSDCWNESGLAVSIKCEEDDVCGFGYAKTPEKRGLIGCLNKKDQQLFSKSELEIKNEFQRYSVTKVEKNGDCVTLEYRIPKVGPIKSEQCRCSTDNCIGTIHGHWSNIGCMDNCKKDCFKVCDGDWCQNSCNEAFCKDLYNEKLPWDY